MLDQLRVFYKGEVEENNKLFYEVGNYNSVEKNIKKSKKAIIKTNESIFLIDLEDIIRCEADGNYTHFYLSDEKKITVSKTLKQFDILFLDNPYFFRIHNSHLINLNFVERIDKKEGGLIVMKDKTVLPMASRRKKELLMSLEFFL